MMGSTSARNGTCLTGAETCNGRLKGSNLSLSAALLFDLEITA